MTAREGQQHAQLRAQAAESLHCLAIIPCPALHGAQNQTRRLRCRRPLGRMARDDVADLVADHRRQLVVVLGDGEQTRRHAHMAGRQDEGVRRGVVEHRIVPVTIGQVRRLDDSIADAANARVLGGVVRHLLRPQGLGPGSLGLLDQRAVVHQNELAAAQRLIIGAAADASADKARANGQNDEDGFVGHGASRQHSLFIMHSLSARLHVMRAQSAVYRARRRAGVAPIAP